MPTTPWLLLYSALWVSCPPTAAFTLKTTSVPSSSAWSTTDQQHTTSSSTWPLWSSKEGRSSGDERISKDNDAAQEKGQLKNSKAQTSDGRFAKGESLKRLRADLDSLRENLVWAEAMEDQERIEDLTKAIRNGENRDPDVVYRRALRAVIDAKASFKLSDEEKAQRVKKWQKEAASAREHLPRFQMEGLWVGNYGEHGLEMINVTYTGDTLVAIKVTGDENVPRGQTSFTSDLAPSNASSLEPLKVSFDREATQLLRYPGKGQIAKKGFTDKKFVEGQLVMFDKHFSFVWVPTRHHVLFRRPTPEQTIAMLRDVVAKEDEIQNMRDHLTRCLDMDMTESLARFHANKGREPFRRIKLSSELQEIENEIKAGSMPAPNSGAFNFLHLHKWKSYIDRVLGETKD